ncbi:transposase, partial [Pseudomonas aeruginosa]|uniref:transposase n=1 Tax=Pseudomonas aeruginosa TaxID=287 RepID=UPI003CC69451
MNIKKINIKNNKKLKNIKKRKETIERVFADAKEKHRVRYTKYRGLEKRLFVN